MPDAPTAAELVALFDLPPEKAIAFFESKGLKVSGGWREMRAEAHRQALTVANVASQDALADIRNGLGKVLKEGQTVEQFKDGLIPLLEKRGWFAPRGERPWVDSDDGLRKRLTARRLETIFHANVQAAYAEGRWQEFVNNKAYRPYVQYVAILDRRTRPRHAALHGYVFAIDDPATQVVRTPLGYRCRCRMRALSQADIKRKNLTVQAGGLDSLVEVEQHLGGDDYRRVTAWKMPNGTLFKGDPGWAKSLQPGAAPDNWRAAFSPAPQAAPPVKPPTAPAPAPAPARPPLRMPPTPENISPEQAFLSNWAGARRQTVTWRDPAGWPVQVGPQMFAGAPPLPERYAMALGQALKNPDEIWLTWHKQSDGKWGIARRYLRAVIDEAGKEKLAVIEIGKTWSATVTDPSDDWRAGQLLWHYSMEKTE